MTRRLGASWKYTPSMSMVECKELCLADPECEEVMHSSGNCFLYNSPGEKEEESDCCVVYEKKCQLIPGKLKTININDIYIYYIYIL